VVSVSRASLWVRFPDGTVKCGIYNGTVDQVWPPLFDTSDEAWDAWHTYYDVRSAAAEHWFDYEDNAGEVVEVAVDYGRGSCWRATATRTHVTSMLSWDERIDAEVEHDGLPEWVSSA
jgi:hypothetical protein